MINGFLVKIINTSSDEQLLPLFNQYALPKGVTVNTRNREYNYTALLLDAQTQGFLGSGINADQILKVIIHDGLNSETMETKFFTEKKSR